ncbi:protein Skeletor, isoforms B/C-like isoform X1 [Watersipora subatra]|uniref:protein Skeletor, isoforms B/C-like isoform X1 n=1 Tax=Watersipora subatra TaxID=2589382 RepID=UPI00355B1679
MQVLRIFFVTLIGLTAVLAVYPYYGKLLQEGWTTEASPEALAGDIYVVDDTRFQVIQFTLTSSFENASFMLGTSRSYEYVMTNGSVDDDAVVIANPSGQMVALRSYYLENVVLTLPDGASITDYKYIAVGNRNTKALYGGVEIPESISVPAPVNIGTFTSRAHQVSSGDVTVLTDRSIRIESFTYDGYGPDAFFYVGTTETVRIQSSPYGKIADENGIIESKAGRYNAKTITLTLPSSISATDLTWLSMFCITYSHNFGEVVFPETLNVPPHLGTVMREMSEEFNCEPLSDDLHISWLVSGDSIMFELAGRIDRSTDYMAFGLSGNLERAQMIGSDIVVADYRLDSEPRAIDYYIQGYAQCSSNGGVCPDDSSFVSSTDDVMGVGAEVNQGITRISYSRALITADVDNQKDQEYKTDGTPQQIVWSIGPINSLNQAAKHYAVGGRLTTSKAINFGRDVADNCPIFEDKDRVELPKFTPHHLYGKEGTVFTAEIGQSASEQGYKALTDLPSWGIAWYINGILVPELHLQRGISYTFRVAGGTNSSLGSMYHPFYFTNSVEGGYEQTQSPDEVIFQGTENGEKKDFAVGDYCEWKLNLDAEEKIYQCFEELKEDLFLDCVNEPTSYTEFVFTPSSDHPSILYYQCYTHKNLGWKINIYDELPTEEIPAQDCTSTATTTAGTTIKDPTATTSALEKLNINDNAGIILSSSLPLLFMALVFCYTA